VDKRLRKALVILHFCCDPPVLTDHGMFLSTLGYRVVNSQNGFETIKLSTSGKIHAVVLELDRNHSDVLLIAREIKRARALIPTVVVVRATQTLDSLFDLVDAVVPDEAGCEKWIQSLEGVLRGRSQQTDLPIPSTDPDADSTRL
jgi:response regulator RpfG family c-di-GMP phosphodiesterase